MTRELVVWRQQNCSEFSNDLAKAPMVEKRFLNAGTRLSWRGFFGSLLAIVLALATIASPALAQQFDKDNLEGSDFSGRDFSGGNFVQTNLRDATLKGTNFTGALMYGVFLDGADLEGANFSYATLDSAHFNRSNLRDAVLEGAFAFNATFNGADIAGADFTDVPMRDDQLRLLCKIADGTNSITGRDTRDTLLCP